MKADLTLSERRRLEAKDWTALRAAFVRRHIDVLDEQHAIEGVQVALAVRSPEYRAMAERLRD